MAKKADAAVMKMRDELLKKKAALLVAEKPVYKAGEYFRPSMSHARGEFQVNMANDRQLLEGVKSILLHKEAADILGMATEHFNFTVEAWIEDFKTRKSVLDRNENLRKVASLEAKLKTVMTPAQLREIGIGDLLSEIEGL